MTYRDDGTTGTRAGEQERTVQRNVGRIEEQRYRLSVYRVGMARMRAEQDAGIAPIQSAWRAGCQMTETFMLDRRASGLLIGCLVAAACRGD